MSDAAETSGVVHWLGAGLSTGTGLVRIQDSAKKVILWNRTKSKADSLLERLGLSDKVESRSYDLESLKASLSKGDIVVCMLPVAEHGTILQTAIDHEAHYVSSSYVSDIILGKADAAKAKKLAVIVESGLDPGIDHLAAHMLVEEAKEKLVEQGIENDNIESRFYSYCGGFPAVANDFKYKFSWAPAGVLLALRSPAQYIGGGENKTAPRPWEVAGPYETSAGIFEAYPNRDSVPFVRQYHFPESWKIDEFVRGTLRLEGWLEAWAEIFEAIKTQSEDDIKKLGAELAEKHFYEADEKDRVVLTVGLEVIANGTEVYNHRYEMDIEGDEADSAMALTVSNGVACAVTDLLEGNASSGLSRAAENIDTVKRWVSRLENWGIKLEKR